MEDGIVYCMETIVKGLVKIGSTKDAKTFKSRMRHLERDGYSNVTGLKKAYAISVDNYKEIEEEIKNKYVKERVGTTELYSLSIEEAIEILTSYNGVQFFSKYSDMSKEELHKLMTRSNKENKDNLYLPSGTYHLDSNGYKAKMSKDDDGNLYLLKGSDINENPTTSFFNSLNKKNSDIWKKMKEINMFTNGKLNEDCLIDNVSAASSIVLGRSDNGWETWKDSKNKLISEYRPNKKKRNRK